MSYNKTVWENDITPVSANNMNKIENELESLDNQINNLVENLSVDYVIEQNTVGMWTYRKWNSGIAECWGVYSATLTNYASSVGGASGQYGYNTGSLAFPANLFIEAPIPTFSAYVGSGFAQTGTITTAISATNCTFYAVTTATGSQSTKWYIRAIGRWK